MTCSLAVCKCAQAATCSCGAQPAQQCNCARATRENAPVQGASCTCGKRQADECTCKNSECREGEIDFTNKKF
ncbi:hypothetical protein TRVA0_008S00826 [Trichomonascus vanleenenianus]|uniref:uncharacterized protein n=1 Tax=Trichomonascus vanleenenianus TaxID=2268995 RepID=UPI003ECB9B80